MDEICLDWNGIGVASISDVTEQKSEAQIGDVMEQNRRAKRRLAM